MSFDIYRKFDNDIFLQLMDESQLSIRKRSHFNLHKTPLDPAQRLFNFIQSDSYIRPHRHTFDSNSETLLAIRGRFALLHFDNDGSIAGTVIFSSENYCDAIYGLEISPTVWHTVIPFYDNSILFEVKNGPFVPERSKELAIWAPEEGTLEACAYFKLLKEFVVSSDLNSNLVQDNS